MIFEMVFSFDFRFGNNWFSIHPQFFSLEFVSNIFAFGLAMVGLSFCSATLNEIALSTTPDDS